MAAEAVMAVAVAVHMADPEAPGGWVEPVTAAGAAVELTEGT
ncbi:hypothetical protein X474_09730 [Dethiosulfatarculus sandiegensis]|uniref:Uncharacterized protein n=1 Tax=Dethiosulfatarculus sandiegensis TaxID=1429043 RepID=A0A0D2J8B4_9BACT|nr:hypothetical protein X474_09730 [Dethiosulfatarculus sandiegensis]